VSIELALQAAIAPNVVAPVLSFLLIPTQHSEPAVNEEAAAAS